MGVRGEEGVLHLADAVELGVSSNLLIFTNIVIKIFNLDLLSSKGLLVMRAASSLFPAIFWKLTSTLTNFLNNLIGFFFENFLIYWLEFRFNMFAKIIHVEGIFFLFFFKFADLYISFSFESLVFLLNFFRKIFNTL